MFRKAAEESNLSKCASVEGVYIVYSTQVNRGKSPLFDFINKVLSFFVSENPLFFGDG